MTPTDDFQGFCFQIYKLGKIVFMYVCDIGWHICIIFTFDQTYWKFEISWLNRLTFKQFLETRANLANNLSKNRRWHNPRCLHGVATYTFVDMVPLYFWRCLVGGVWYKHVNMWLNSFFFRYFVAQFPSVQRGFLNIHLILQHSRVATRCSKPHLTHRCLIINPF